MPSGPSRAWTMNQGSNMTPNDRTEVTSRDVFITRAFNAPRELVWRFWTEPAALASWFGPTGVSVPVDSVLIELVAGGRWELAMRNDQTGELNPIRGKIVSFKRPEHLEIKMDADATGGALHDILLRVEFHDHGSRTRVTLHQGPFTADLRDLTAEGWYLSFHQLDTQLKAVTK